MHAADSQEQGRLERAGGQVKAAKRAVWLGCVVGLLVFERAQARVDFTNLGNGINAPVFDVNGETPLSGGTFLAQLYAGTSPDPASLMAVGGPVSFGTGQLAGYFDGGTVSIPFIPPGSALFVQVRVWTAACGASYEQALAAGCPTGQSAVLQLVLPQANSPPAPLTGLQAFQLGALLEAPFIIRHPRSQVVGAGDRAILNVRAFGSAPLVCQWRFNGENIAGATNFTLVLNEFRAGFEGSYMARVANAAGAAVSAVAYLVLLPGAPEISRHPATQTAELGGRVTFQVETIGAASVRYQWRKNGVHLLGQTNATLIINGVEPADGGTYTVEVASPLGAVRSQKAFLRLAIPVLEASDFFDSRKELDKSGSLRSNNREATDEQGEPDHAGQPGNHSVWFSWLAPGTGVARFSTAGSTFDTLLAVYQGESVFRLDEVAADDDGGGAHTSEVRFNVREGERYEVAVDGLTGASGEFVLTWEHERTETLLPEIIRHPRSQTVLEGAAARWEIGVEGRDLRFQWFHNGRIVDGATALVLALPSVAPPQVGTYEVEVVVSGQGEAVRSRPARLEIGPVPTAQTQDKLVGLLSRPADVTGGGGGGGGFPSLPTAVPVTLGSINSQIFDNTGGGTEEDELIHCHVISANSAWFALVAEESALMVLDTIGSNFDTLLAVYVGPAVDDPNFWLEAQLIACDYNSAPDGIRSQLSFLTEKGATYYVMVDGAGSSSGTTFLNWRLVNPPVARGEGQQLFLTMGMDVGLEPAKTSSTGSSLQWFHDGTLLPDQTNRRLYVSNIQLGQAGQYSLRETVGVTSNTELIFTLAVARIEAQPNAPPRVLVQSTEPVVMETSGEQMNGWDWAAAVPGGMSFHHNETDPAPFKERFYRVRLP